MALRTLWNETRWIIISKSVFLCTFPYTLILYALAVVFFIWVYISFPLSAYFLLSFSAVVCIILLFHIILSELFCFNFFLVGSFKFVGWVDVLNVCRTTIFRCCFFFFDWFDWVSVNLGFFYYFGSYLFFLRLRAMRIYVFQCICY